MAVDLPLVSVAIGGYPHTPAPKSGAITSDRLRPGFAEIAPVARARRYDGPEAEPAVLDRSRVRGSGHDAQNRPGLHGHAAIQREIILRHPAGGEAALELLPDGGGGDLIQPGHGGDRLGFVMNDEAGDAVIEDLRDRARR